MIVPDRHGTGTNGLLLAPPDAIAPSFGPGSCERHRALARAAGVACRVERVPSLLLDIDTGADLDVLRARLAGHPARAARTRAVLGQPERTRRLSMTSLRLSRAPTWPASAHAACAASRRCAPATTSPR